MGMSEREYHIKVLENLLSHYKAREQCEGYYDSTLKDNVEALEYAILSIKTDEAYQIMYEGEEIFTKADMVAMLTELSMKIGEIEDGYTEFDEENKRSLTMIPLESVERLIDGEINSLKEIEDGQTNY